MFLVRIAVFRFSAKGFQNKLFFKEVEKLDIYVLTQLWVNNRLFQRLKYILKIVTIEDLTIVDHIFHNFLTFSGNTDTNFL